MAEMVSLRVMRYLTFEMSRACPMVSDHPKCPIGHPERYRFGVKDHPLTDDQILDFWQWAQSRQFRGIILWHWYNEPTLSMPRIRSLMERMKAIDPYQPFQLFTNDPDAQVASFDLVKITDYASGKDLDDRIASAWGDGRRQPHQPTGYCGRSWGWELPIDVYGNWCLCCNDWRCEESVGNIKAENWDELLRRFYAKSSQIKWKDQASWDALPRMCRSCMDVNFSLHRTGGSFPTP